MNTIVRLGSATPTIVERSPKICTVLPMTDESPPNFRCQNPWLKIVICGGSLAGSNGSGLPSGPFGGGGGGAASASTKLRPKAMRVPSNVKKFGVTPATAICSGLASSPTNGPGNVKIPAIDWNAVARSRRSGQSPGMIGKSTTFRVRMSDLISASRFGCAYGSGRSSTAFTTLKIAVVAPVPSAIVMTAVRVNAG